MNANEKFIAAEAHVDEAAIAPLPNSRKIYVEGSRPDLRVPMREITQSDTLGQRLAALLRDTESEARRTNAMCSGARSRPIGPWLGARG